MTPTGLHCKPIQPRSICKTIDLPIGAHDASPVHHISPETRQKQKQDKRNTDTRDRIRNTASRARATLEQTSLPEWTRRGEAYLIRRSLSGRDVIDSAGAGILPRQLSDLPVTLLFPGETVYNRGVLIDSVDRVKERRGPPFPGDAIPQSQWSCADVKRSSSARWCCC